MFEKVYARVGAKVLIRNVDGNVLVLRRSSQMSRPGGWDFPGGASEIGEQMNETAVREAREETGIILSDVKLCTTHAYIDESGDYIVLLGFIAHTNATLVHLSNEHDQYQWLSPTELRELSWPSFHQKLVDELTKNS